MQNGTQTYKFDYIVLFMKVKNENLYINIDLWH